MSRAVGRRVSGLVLIMGSEAWARWWEPCIERCRRLFADDGCSAVNQQGKTPRFVLWAPNSYQQHLPNGTFCFTSQFVVGERVCQPTHERRRSSGISLPRQDARWNVALH